MSGTKKTDKPKPESQTEVEEEEFRRRLKRLLDSPPKPHKGKDKNDELSVDRTRIERGEESDDD